MCTVVYIPQTNSISFASLRDESPLRVKAILPRINQMNKIEALSPIDPFGKGTWIGVTKSKTVVILLNGAFENHQRKASYSKSRGLVTKELLGSYSPIIEWSIMDLDNVEPFTLVVFNDNHLFELVWDGEKKHRKLLQPDKSHIWSSSTLYDREAKQKRKEEFDNWMAMSPPVNKLSLLEFFKSFTDKTNGFIMNRNEKVKTLSYSFVEIVNDNATFDYYDFSEFKHYKSEILINNNKDQCEII